MLQKQKPPGDTGRLDSLHLMQQKTRQFANERPAMVVAVVVVVLVVVCPFVAFSCTDLFPAATLKSGVHTHRHVPSPWSVKLPPAGIFTALI